jgi:hypothetical protein
LTAGDIVGYADRDGLIINDEDIYDPKLGRELSEQEIRTRRLIPLHTRYKPRVADLTNIDAYLLARERELVKIITPDVESYDTVRNNKINYYANSQLKIEDIAEVYDQIKAVNKRHHHHQYQEMKMASHSLSTN